MKNYIIICSSIFTLKIYNSAAQKNKVTIPNYDGMYVIKQSNSKHLLKEVLKK